jgi:hypothetical protein
LSFLLIIRTKKTSSHVLHASVLRLLLLIWLCSTISNN